MTNLEFANRLLGKPSPNIDPNLLARFEIYETNFLGGLTEALAQSFPVVRALVGAAYFEMLAYNYIRACPPSSPIIAQYGAGFGDFLENASVKGSIAYLPDMARLEYARLHALHATDVIRWSGLHQEGVEALLDRNITLHPSVTLIASPHPIVTIWLAHQTEPIEAVEDWSPQSVLIYRGPDALAHLVIEPQEREWLDRLCASANLGASLGCFDTTEEATVALQLTLRLLMLDALVTEPSESTSIHKLRIK